MACSSPRESSAFTMEDKENYFLLAEAGNLEKFRKCTICILRDRDAYGGTYLHRAVAKCCSHLSCDPHLNMLEYIIAEAPQLITERNQHGETALCLACKSEWHPKVITLLAQSGPESINMSDNNERTPLLNVLRQGMKSCTLRDGHLQLEYCLQILKVLIENGADVNLESSHGENALHFVLKNHIPTKHDKFEKLVKFLLLQNTNYCSSMGLNALSIVKCKKIASTLLNNDSSNLNQNDKVRGTPLRYQIVTNGAKNAELIKYFIEKGAVIGPDTNIITFAHEYGCEFSIIQMLLKRHPDYNINKRNTHGKTLLISYGRNVSIVSKLLSIGADATLIDDYGNTALLAASRGKDTKAIKLLLQSRADPLKFSKVSLNISVAICKECASRGCKFEEWFQLFKYLLNLPQMKDTSLPLTLQNTYFSLFNVLFDSENWNVYKANLPQILSVMLEANPSIKMLIIHDIYLNDINIVEVVEPIFEPFGFAIAKFIGLIDQKNDVSEDYFKQFIKVLFDVDLYTASIDNECISPLTVLLLSTNIKTDLEFIIINKLINKGVNVESSAIYVWEDSLVEDLNALKCSILLPDALLISFLNGKYSVVDILLSHWWAPPIALLIFKPTPWLEDLEFWFPILLPYGGIPHGTKIFQLLLKNLEAASKEMKEKCSPEIAVYWQKYQDLIANPLSLQCLCKYVVRQSLAARASLPDISLPELLHQELPPLLRRIVIH